MSAHSADAWRTTMKRRLLVAAVFIAGWAVVIEARLVYLQVVRYEALTAVASEQQSNLQTIPGGRGEIVDRNGEVLALSVNAPSITANPALITDIEGTAGALCRVLSCSRDDRERLRTRLASTRKSGRKFAYVKRRVSDREAEQVAALELPGLSSIKELRRYYPNRELLAHVLGYVGADNQGLGGLEHAYDAQVKGRDGKVLVLAEGTKSEFLSQVETAPTSGSTLELTIDKYIQHVAEREIAAAVRENEAAAGTAVVMDPWTGEILAMASYPTFDPNDALASSAAARRNRAVQEVYEPGSTFKIVTASAALEQGVVDPDDLIDTTGGRISFGSDTIFDTHDYGMLSFADVFVKSSNVGAIKVALRLGAAPLTDYARRFGFGRRLSNAEFLGEQPGRVWSAGELRDPALARVSIGYQISVTPLQMAAAVSSIANGGELIAPHVVRAIITDGVRTAVPKRTIGRTVEPAVAAKVTAMMEGVVERGTATQAQIAGYAVAGKTGTASKWTKQGYSPTDYNASFVGFVPSQRPGYTIVVVIDSPHGRNGFYGGPVAAPVFRRIADAVLRRGAVPPSVNPSPPLIVDRRRDGAGEQRATAAGRTAGLVRVRLDPAALGGLYPDVTGVSAREAVRALAAAGVQVVVEGSGLVIAQRPPAGSPIEPGQKATVWLSRHPAVFQASGVAAP